MLEILAIIGLTGVASRELKDKGQAVGWAAFVPILWILFEVIAITSIGGPDPISAAFVGLASGAFGGFIGLGITKALSPQPILGPRSAGFCSKCQRNVWLKPSGWCENGHSKKLVSNVHIPQDQSAALGAPETATAPAAYAPEPTMAAAPAMAASPIASQEAEQATDFFGEPYGASSPYEEPSVSSYEEPSAPVQALGAQPAEVTPAPAVVSDAVPTYASAPPSTCPACGMSLSADSVFCTGCGARVAFT